MTFPISHLVSIKCRSGVPENVSEYDINLTLSSALLMCL